MKKLTAILASVVLMLSLAVTASAEFVSESEVPSIDAVWDSKTYPYAIITGSSTEGFPHSHLSVYMFKNEPIYEDGDIISTGGYAAGTATNSSQGFYTVSPSDNTIRIKSSTLVKSSFNIMNGTTVIMSADRDFFKLPPLPLAEVIQGVTEETMQGTLPGLDGTMKVLVPCGVGLMASLVVLSLFGKRSLLFLR